jgi:hypothetical protein
VPQAAGGIRACRTDAVSYPLTQIPCSSGTETHRLGLVRQAAVLVALFQRPGEDGLRVLLTTRASHMRRNPGQTVRCRGKEGG